MTDKAKKQLESEEMIDLTNQFAGVEGRRPRVLVALTKSELNSEFNEISSALADLGFDVDISPKFMSSTSLGRQAVENDVHALLVLTEASSVRELAKSIGKELAEQNRGDILLIIKTNSPVNIDTIPGISVHSKVFGRETNTNTLAKHMMNTLA